MDFDLSADQEALVEAAEALLDSKASMTEVRKASERTDRIDRSLWSQMADQGWMAIEQPESAGGLGMGFVEVAVLSEQLGAHLGTVPFAGTVLALWAIEHSNRAADESASTRDGRSVPSDLVDRLSTGQAIGAVAWCRRPEQVVARRTEGNGSGWSLVGRPDPVVFGPVADVVVVPATIRGTGERDEEQALFAVTDLPAESRRVEPAMDLTRSVGWLDLEGTQAILLGDAAECAAVVDRAATIASAEMLGAAQRVLEMSVEYAKDREQFGRPIGSFQAIKHRCADMLVDVEGMRSAVYYAAWSIEAGNTNAPASASAAKIWCSEAASRVMGSGLQVHGGIGFTWEHDLHFFVKRSQLDQVSFGTAAYHRDRLAAILRPLAEAGLPVL
jgi:alkylation response protein AidB-like acyl-CoA dehydrogenase